MNKTILKKDVQENGYFKPDDLIMEISEVESNIVSQHPHNDIYLP